MLRQLAVLLVAFGGSDGLRQEADFAHQVNLGSDGQLEAHVISTNTSWNAGMWTSFLNDIISSLSDFKGAAIINMNPKRLDRYRKQTVTFQYSAETVTNKLSFQIPLRGVALIKVDDGDTVDVFANQKVSLKCSSLSKRLKYMLTNFVSLEACKVKEDDDCKCETAADEPLCTGVHKLQKGKVYIYRDGTCARPSMVEITNLEDRNRAKEELCGQMGDQADACMLSIACAFDSLFYFDFPLWLGDALVVPSTQEECKLRKGSDISAPEFEPRKGPFHLGQGCWEHVAPDIQEQGGGYSKFCGTEGLCCRSPGALWGWSWTEQYTAGGCDRKGCNGRHCCVAK